MKDFYNSLTGKGSIAVNQKSCDLVASQRRLIGIQAVFRVHLL